MMGGSLHPQSRPTSVQNSAFLAVFGGQQAIKAIESSRLRECTSSSNPKVVSSNLTPATNFMNCGPGTGARPFLFHHPFREQVPYRLSPLPKAALNFLAGSSSLNDFIPSRNLSSFIRVDAAGGAA